MNHYESKSCHKATSDLPCEAELVTKDGCENFNNHVVLEGMSSISALINGIRTGINQRKIHQILFDEQKNKSKQKELHFLKSVQGEFGFELSFVHENVIDRVSSGKTHGGIVALCTDRPLPLLSEEALNSPPWNLSDGFFVLLEGIEDPYNFGYILRSLYAAGVDGVILPERNWMSAAGVVARSSAGASELLELISGDADRAVSFLKSKGYRVVCAGIRDSVSTIQADLKRPILLVIGGEKRGISRSVLDRADQIVRIDYGREFRGSLSASAAAAVLAFEVLRQNQSEVE